MARGGKRPGAGRPKGAKGKVNQEFRETVRKLLEDNSTNVGAWLERVAAGDPESDVKPDPARALDLLARLAEYAAPKLARTEHVGDPDKPLYAVTRVELIDGDGKS